MGVWARRPAGTSDRFHLRLARWAGGRRQVAPDVKGSALSNHLDPEVTRGSHVRRRRALRAAMSLLFVAGVALGATVHIGRGGAVSGAAGTQVSAWMALPENHGAVTPVREGDSGEQNEQRTQRARQ